MLGGNCNVWELPVADVVGVFHISLGVLAALIISLALIYLYVRDITQKRHTVLRNYPIIGRLRFFFEDLGEYFRQYFFLGDRDEMPFNRRHGPGSIEWQKRGRYPRLWFDLRT